jgi:hypothetical protein
MKRRTLLTAAGALAAAGAELAVANNDDARGARDRRQELYSLLGKLPPRDRPVTAKRIATQDRGSYTLEKLVLDLNGEEPAPAYFAKPKGKAAGKLPTVLFNHSHGGGYAIGKQEFIEGREYMGNPPYAEFLTSLGYNALCFDAWIFGERSGRAELDFFKEKLWRGQWVWGMMVYDALKAVDYLHTRADVDTARLATVGMSMGSSTAQWVGALDPRLKVVVDICCLTDWHTLVDVGGLKGHGIYYYIPDLLSHFTAAQMNALIAPRAHLALAGNQDALTPLAGLEKIDRELQGVYAAAGHAANWKLLRYDVGHQETPAMREQIRDWLVAKL